VAGLHRASFPNFFASQLREWLLRDLYAEAVCHDELAHVALDPHGGVAGFVMGSAAESAFSRSLAIRRFPSPGARVDCALAERFQKVARTALKPARPDDRSGTATLMFVAVGPNLRGRGADKTLVAEFVSDVARRGAMRVELVTLRDGNQGTNDFYRTLASSRCLASGADARRPTLSSALDSSPRPRRAEEVIPRTRSSMRSAARPW
jgi:ribosomal protein S18 acetylase RimI-like enzyme